MQQHLFQVQLLSRTLNNKNNQFFNEFLILRRKLHISLKTETKPRRLLIFSMKLPAGNFELSFCRRSQSFSPVENGRSRCNTYEKNKQWPGETRKSVFPDELNALRVTKHLKSNEVAPFHAG